MQLYVSEYFLQSVLSALFYDGLIVLPPIAIDGLAMEGLKNLIDIYPGLKKQFTDHGYNPSTMACQMIVYGANATDSQPPILNITTE